MVKINKLNNNNIFKNVVISFIGQLITIILGFIVPRLLISNYGSDINGLLSTVTQIFSYMALLEAGVGQASRNALFKPIAENNQNDINIVVSNSYRYFRKLTVLYIAGVIAFSFLAPLFLKSNVDNITIFLIIIFEGMSGAINFYFVETPTVFLSAYGKNYVNNEISLGNKTLTYFARIILAYLRVNIVIIQVSYFIISIIKVLVYRIYIRKKFQWLKYDRTSKIIKLPDRNSYVVTELAWTIFSSTDMIILSTFASTELASVYSVYNMVFNQISTLLNAIYASVVYVLGYSYHKGIDKYSIVHDSFTSIFLGIMTTLMSVCYILIIPFVKMYTENVADINYIYNSLPVMFCLIQILSWSRYVSGNLTGLSGYAKQTSYVSLIEALTNLVLSIILVKKLGIIGVTFATVIALPLKVIWCIYVSDIKVMKRSAWHSIRILLSNYLFFALVILFYKINTFKIDGIKTFIFYGILLTIIFGLLNMLLNIAINKNMRKMITSKFSRHNNI